MPELRASHRAQRHQARRLTFGGTGTTAAVAHALGHHGISIDLSADYQRLARWRIEESGLVGRVQQRTYGRDLDPKPQPVPENHLTLF